MNKILLEQLKKIGYSEELEDLYNKAERVFNLFDEKVYSFPFLSDIFWEDTDVLNVYESYQVLIATLIEGLIEGDFFGSTVNELGYEHSDLFDITGVDYLVNNKIYFIVERITERRDYDPTVVSEILASIEKLNKLLEETEFIKIEVFYTEEEYEDNCF
jgi:hypothetical protein